MRQIFYLDTNRIFERACEMRGFGDCGDLSWREWYDFKSSQTGFTDGELERATAELLDIPFPARNGFAVTGIDAQNVILQDLEECNTCDLSDPDDSNMIIPVTQFREWLYNWSKEAVNRVMDTNEAAALWGYSSADAVKRLCREGKVKCKKLTNGTYILDKNQPNPKHKL